MQNGTQVVKTVSKTTSPLSATKTGATTTNKVSLYTAPVTNLADNHVAHFTATATLMFWRITATDQQTSGSFVCNCSP
ncbi:hypothetical protein PRIPAC_80159 [Pristionchus pacificus]|uniref:Uncharacterized protein n=1 Tax=Pristionchus pacificus TaxID=54126 RepID=A0A2A6C2S0_PRIPA|nr:hypothetical protein PRIPAC_80159 [Pristionchus pacificus]|eukprot:PDM72333.1 hypothetical protein PRIPAC_38767 [Pristionchus pacificus]